MRNESHSGNLILGYVVILLLISSTFNSNVKIANKIQLSMPHNGNGFFAFAYQVTETSDITAKAQNQSTAYNPSYFNRTRLASSNDVLTPPVPTLSSGDIQRMHEIALNDSTVQHWIAIAHGNYTVIPGYEYGYSYNTPIKRANDTSTPGANTNTVYTFSNPAIAIRVFGKDIAIVNHITTASVLTNPNAIDLHVIVDPSQNIVEKVEVGAVMRPSIEGTIISDNSPFRVITPFTIVWILGGAIGTASVVIYLKSIRKL